MKIFNHFVQQGDVPLVPLESLPKGVVERPRTGDIILALGEITGHAHRIKDVQVRWFSGPDDAVYIEVAEGGAEVLHEEHGTVKLTPGIYAVPSQFEYDPTLDQSFRVLD